MNKTTVKSVEEYPNPLGDFKPSLAFRTGSFASGYIYAFVYQNANNTSALIQRKYRSLRFTNGINGIENYTKRSKDYMYLNLPVSSKGPYLLIGVFGPFIHNKKPFYSIFRSIDKRIEYCLLRVSPPNGSLFSDEAVSAYN